MAAAADDIERVAAMTVALRLSVVHRHHHNMSACRHRWSVMSRWLSAPRSASSATVAAATAESYVLGHLLALRPHFAHPSPPRDGNRCPHSSFCLSWRTRGRHDGKQNETRCIRLSVHDIIESTDPARSRHQLKARKSCCRFVCRPPNNWLDAACS